MNYTVTESGLQQDQPPAVGNISSLVVVILQNDNAEGILEFSQDDVNITGKSPNKSNLKLRHHLIQSRYYSIYTTLVFLWLYFFQLRRTWASC